jgi:hypothetical protein
MGMHDQHQKSHHTHSKAQGQRMQDFFRVGRNEWKLEIARFFFFLFFFFLISIPSFQIGALLFRVCRRSKHVGVSAAESSFLDECLEQASEIVMLLYEGFDVCDPKLGCIDRRKLQGLEKLPGLGPCRRVKRWSRGPRTVLDADICRRHGLGLRMVCCA